MAINNPEFNKICLMFHEDIQEVIAGHEPTEALMTWIYEYYLNSGEMPYGVAKARTGDPYEWCLTRFLKDYGAN